MQAKSIDGGTAWTRKPFHAFRIDLISVPSRTSIGAGDDLATHRRGIEVCQPGFIRKRIGLLRIAVGTETALPEKRPNSRGQCFRQSHDFRVIRSGQDLKLRPIVIICGIDPINENRVDMEIEPQSRVEALDKRDRTSLRLALGAEFAGPLDERRKNRTCENAKYIGYQTRIIG